MVDLNYAISDPGDEQAVNTGAPANDVDRPPPIGLFQKPDEDLLKQIRLWWKESADAQSKSRTRRDEEWAMLAGHQWEKTDEERMKAGSRPALTINLLQSMMAAVEGQERNNKQEMKVYGEGGEDDPTAFALNRLFKWVMNQCGGEFTLSGQFRSGACIGEGWLGFDVDYFTDPEGLIKLVLVDECEAYADPLSVDPVGDDLRYFHRVRMYAADEMEARWPGSIDKLKTACDMPTDGPETDGKGYRDIYLTPDNTNSPKFYDAAKKQWAVLETWWTQIESGWVVVDEATGLLVEKTDDEFGELKNQREQEQQEYIQKLTSGQLHAERDAAYAEQLQAMPPPMATPAPAPPPQPGPAGGGNAPAPMPPAGPASQPPASPLAAMIGAPAPGPMAPPVAPPPPPPIPPMPAPLQATQRPIKRLYQAFTAYETVLSRDASELPLVKRIPYVPFRAMYDKRDKVWYGLLRSLVDLQKQHNVEQSAMIQLVQLMPKSSWMGPKGTFQNRREWEQKVATPGAMLEYNGRIGKPEQIKTEAIPRHLVEMAMSRPQSMREISGINIELTGVKQGQDPGVVMEQRTKAALTVLAPLFDNFRETKKVAGMILLAYVQRFVSPGRRIRVIGDKPGDISVVQMTQDMTIGRYDVTVEESNATINDRTAALNILQTTLPMMLKSGMPMPPDIIDLLPIEPSIRDSMKRQMAYTMAIQGQLPPPNWKIGDPVPMPAAPAPPGLPPPGPTPQAPPG